MTSKVDKFIEKMQHESLPEEAIDAFTYYYSHLADGGTGYIGEDEIDPVLPDQIYALDEVHTHKWEAMGRKLLSKTAIIKLNGGLGTSMGLEGPKSLIPVKNGLNFLDVTALQIRVLDSKYDCRIPLLLMNSFKTELPTNAVMDKYKDIQNGIPDSFVQHKFPKVLASNLEPAYDNENPQLEWNPPGHGDLYTSIVTSGILEKLLEKGITYAFISNIDNLGAIMDLGLLGYFVDNKYSFMMEVTKRTAMDKKGGHLARLKNGKLVLREKAQCRDEDKYAFQNIERYQFFNTNNLWLNLQAFYDEMKTNGRFLKLPMIRNAKKMDPRDSASPDVYQLESAMGAAISVLDSTCAVRVPRTRFVPIKSCQDLLPLWSDYFQLTNDYTLIKNPKRVSDHIPISLDDAYYKFIDQVQERFPFGAPSLVQCNSLSISGDIKFGKDIAIHGNVSINNPNKKQAIVQNESVIDCDISF